MKSGGDNWGDDLTVVVTTDPDEDSEVCEMYTFKEYVNSATLKLQLKNSQRLWKAGGPLTGFIFDQDTFEVGTPYESPMWTISPEYLWTAHSEISDGEGHNQLLSQYGFIAAGESLFEMETDDLNAVVDVEAINNMLISLGAKKVSIPH
jgi:hypothetical protein